MLLINALVGTLLAATQALAAHPKGVLNAVHYAPRNGDLDAQIRRQADDIIARLGRRQNPSATASAPTISTTPQSGDASKVDLNKWDAQTQQACLSALNTLNGLASNPSGMAVCYNLPFLDNTTGVFEAELRMYNVSAPTAEWVGTTVADVSMSLTYLGATVQQTNGTFIRRDTTLSWPPVRRDFVNGELVYRQAASDPPPGEIKVLSYVGKVNSNLMGSKAMNNAALQPLLVPTIVLSATNPTTGKQVSATLSSTEASFVNGVFAQASVTQNSFNQAAAKASATAAADHKGKNYILPGTSLAFFPVGLVITCVWTAGLFLSVGLGTVGRMQFREQYRRRMKREMTAGVRTI